MDKIKIRITKSSGWAKEGDVHEVNNYVCFNWGDECTPHFEKDKGFYGIECANCEVLHLESKIPEYTMDELFEKVGSKFKIKGA